MNQANKPFTYFTALSVVLAIIAVMVTIFSERFIGIYTVIFTIPIFIFYCILGLTNHILSNSEEDKSNLIPLLVILLLIPILFMGSIF